MRNYSTCMSRTIAHIRLHIDELPAFTVCDLRVDVGGLFVLRDFLENTVVYSCKVVLPVVDIEAKIVGGVAFELDGIVDVKVDTADREEVVAEVDTADLEEVVDRAVVLGADGSLEEVNTSCWQVLVNMQKLKSLQLE